MPIGVIGLGNIGGAIAANLVADGNEVVVFDLDAAAMEAITGASVATDVASLAAQTEITLLSLPTPEVVNAVADAWATAAPPGSILVDLSTNSPAAVRELGGRDWPLRSSPGRGAPDRWRHRSRETDAGLHGGWGRRAGRPRPAGARAARTGHVPRGRTRSREHHEAAQQPDRLHDHLGQPRGIVVRHQGGDRGARRRGDLAHGRRVELLHRPAGRDDRRPRPTDAVRPGTGGQGRRPHRRLGRGARRADAGGGRRARSARQRGRAGPGRRRLERAASPSPNAKATSRCAGTRRPGRADPRSTRGRRPSGRGGGSGGPTGSDGVSRCRGRRRRPAWRNRPPAHRRRSRCA